jgi:hypothetical protein
LSSQDFAAQLGRLLDGLSPEEQAEATAYIKSLTESETGSGAQPNYDTYYNQTDEKILELIKGCEGRLDNWYGIVSHLNSTTYLEKPQELLKMENEIHIAYWEDALTHKDPQTQRVLRGLRHWALVRVNDARNGHRSNMLRERVNRRILELPQKRRRWFGL